MKTYLDICYRFKKINHIVNKQKKLHYANLQKHVTDLSLVEVGLIQQLTRN